jgi:Tol biopolymer transport system component
VRVGYLAAVAAVAVSLVPASATHAGDYVPPPGDGYPVWSPDGEHIGFLTAREGVAFAVVGIDGSGERQLVRGIASTGPYPDPTRIAVSPDWQWAAVVRSSPGGLELTAVRLDGSEERPLAKTAYGTQPVWSPDSRRIAFRQSDQTLAVVGLDGSVPTRFASAGATPSWSPDGTRIAYLGGVPNDLDVHVVGADGQGDRLFAGGPGAQLEPKWSPDGTRIAFLTQPAVGTSFALAVARADGSDARTYPGPGVSNPGQFQWTPDGRSIVYARGSTDGIWTLDLQTGQARRVASFGGTPAVSSDGSRIAFAAVGECRDREGIYVVAATGGQASRITNGCRIIGTARDDVLRGTDFGDVLVGLAGDDRLFAKDAGYVGDTLLGGDGHDTLVGSERSDILRGGAGSDRLLGGNSQDDLDGGPGRDRINGGRGDDVIHARDGRRDIIACGTSTARHERDEAWVDRYDVVSRDCEVVHRTR